jgi:hypothetical protein
MAINIKLRRGTQSEWNSENPVLSDGEIVAETDTRKIKIGDGTTVYNSLPYGFDPGSSIVLNSFFF